MALFNRKKAKKIDAGAHLNWMAGPCWDISNPLTRLRVAASSCFFGEPMYYQRDRADRRKVRHNPPSRLSDDQVEYLRGLLQARDPQEWRKLSPTELLERCIDEALGADPEATLREAARLRQQEHIRVTPQVILVRAAHHQALKGTGLVRRYAPEIIRRADEPATGLAYQLARFGKPVPNSLKRAWKDALERYDDYQLAKYRLEGHLVKTLDVVKLSHAHSASIDKLAKDTLRSSGRTWEAIVSGKGSTAESWREALDVMGHMALLRNLRNLLTAGIDSKALIERLRAGAATGQQLPFRYYSAWLAVAESAPPELKAAIEDCLLLSLGRLPRFSGRSMSLCDNSGSAQSTTTSALGTVKISSIANLSGVLTGMVSDEGWLGVFGDKLERQVIHPKASVFAQLAQAERLATDIGQGTEHGIWLFWERAIREREHWDRVFVYSDMQAGHGGLYGNPGAYPEYQWNGHYVDVPRLIAAYRAKVNPLVQVFLVQVAGYQDTIMPEFYDRSYVLGGWGEGLLRFAAEMEALASGT